MICVSIIDKNIAKCLEILGKCEMAELRFDKIQSKISDIKKLLDTEIPIIATCRSGFYSDEQRFEILSEAIKNGAAYVDIEIDSAEEYFQKLITVARCCNCKVIISYHNFKETPEENILRNIISQAAKYKPDLIKIVTTAQTFEDAGRIVNLQQQNEKIIAFAMGKCGEISRLQSYKHGAPFIYAAYTRNRKSAKGQLTVDEIKKYFDL